MHKFAPNEAWSILPLFSARFYTLSLCLSGISEIFDLISSHFLWAFVVKQTTTSAPAAARVKLRLRITSRTDDEQVDVEVEWLSEWLKLTPSALLIYPVEAASLAQLATLKEKFCWTLLARDYDDDDDDMQY